MPALESSEELTGEELAEVEAWEKFYEKAEADIKAMDLHSDQANIIWEIGKAGWKAYKDTGYQE